MKNLCTFHSKYTLCLNDNINLYNIKQFCNDHFIRKLYTENNRLLYDYIRNNNIEFLDRLPAYIATTFILSNLSRYIETYVETIRESLNLKYYLTAFFDAAERYVPQLILELIRKKPMCFVDEY